MTCINSLSLPTLPLPVSPPLPPVTLLFLLLPASPPSYSPEPHVPTHVFLANSARLILEKCSSVSCAFPPFYLANHGITSQVRGLSPPAGVYHLGRWVWEAREERKRYEDSGRKDHWRGWWWWAGPILLPNGKLRFKTKTMFSPLFVILHLLVFLKSSLYVLSAYFVTTAQVGVFILLEGGKLQVVAA